MNAYATLLLGDSPSLVFDMCAVRICALMFKVAFAKTIAQGSRMLNQACDDLLRHADGGDGGYVRLWDTVCLFHTYMASVVDFAGPPGSTNVGSFASHPATPPPSHTDSPLSLIHI